MHDALVQMSTVFPRIDARVFISFVTPWTRHLNVLLLRVFLAHAHPCYVAVVVHAEIEIHFSSCDHMASQGSDKHTQ